MGVIKIKKGLDVPIDGRPKMEIHSAREPKTVALVGYDYVGLRPDLKVAVGDRVDLGQVLFYDKKMPAVKFTAPGSGEIIAINRGPKRVFESIIIKLDGTGERSFEAVKTADLPGLRREKVRELLLDSGLWTSLRARPFGKVADPEKSPRSIFITAMDTSPLAPDTVAILEGQKEDFINGMMVLSRLTDGPLFLCKAPGAAIPEAEIPSLTVREFAGPHPAGNPGTHIHFLDPVNRHKTVWHIGAQDVAAIGGFITSGRIPTGRTVALAGPGVTNPRMLRTRLGAALDDITAGERVDGDSRIISGSVLCGRESIGAVRYLGRFHQQISVVREETKRRFLGWMSPGLQLFSSKRIVFSRLLNRSKFSFSTALHGGRRAILPLGVYEDVMPLDILPTYLLRALMVDDIEEAEKLGCLELIEEDLGLCTFVSPSKIEYGPVLRRNLTIIEKEG